jgi:hypothetical protein
MFLLNYMYFFCSKLYDVCFYFLHTLILLKYQIRSKLPSSFSRYVAFAMRYISKCKTKVRMIDVITCSL